MLSEEKESFLEIPLSEIGESYGRLRLIQPQADARMVDSLRQFGQVFAVVVTERYELIDGFKRVRALRRLGVERVKAKVFKLGVPALKAVLIDLNWSRGSISDLEEVLVVQSLCREDGLSQVEVAILLGRHWIEACKTGSATRSNFDFAGPLKEAVLLGSACIHNGGDKLSWDSESLKITNDPDANKLLHYEYRKGWSL